MSDRAYEILEALHEDALEEHRRRPSTFTAMVLRVVGEALTAMEQYNPAQEMGRRGGRSGGPARAKKLSARERHDIAVKAATARWKKGEPT